MVATLFGRLSRQSINNYFNFKKYLGDENVQNDEHKAFLTKSFITMTIDRHCDDRPKLKIKLKTFSYKSFRHRNYKDFLQCPSRLIFLNLFCLAY